MMEMLERRQAQLCRAAVRWVAERPLPGWLRKRALAELFRATAAAFEVEVPLPAGLDAEACLAAYARFTQAQAERQLRDGRGVGAAQERLYRNAAELGQRCATWLRPRTVPDVMALAHVLYRLLAIDLQGDARGQVVIGHCYFSRFYSAEVCRLMSAIDCGLFAGLTNEGELTFTARITEGQPYCRAQFRREPPMKTRITTEDAEVSCIDSASSAPLR